MKSRIWSLFNYRLCPACMTGFNFPQTLLIQKNKGKGMCGGGRDKPSAKSKALKEQLQRLYPACLCLTHCFSPCLVQTELQSQTREHILSTTWLGSVCLDELVNTVISLEIAIRWWDPEIHMGSWAAWSAEADPVVCLRAQLSQGTGLEVK